MLRLWERETGKFGFIKRVDEGQLPPRKIWKADVSSVSPLSEGMEELWLLLVFMRVWKSFAIGGNMVT